MSGNRRYKIVYCTPALYMAGGVERVLTLKVNYFAEQYGYDITIILTEGKDIPFFYPLSERVKVINLDINFEELWTCSFVKKIYLYLKKQRKYRKALKKELIRLHPDITISLLRREINFISSIPDGSRKFGEMHVNRANYRNFESWESNVVKQIFSKIWMKNLVRHLKSLDEFIVLTEEDKRQWPELDNITSIPDPLTFFTDEVSPLKNRRVIAVGRYVYQKGFDLLLSAWAKIEKLFPDWELVIYGSGNRVPYENLLDSLGIDRNRCHLNGPSNNIMQEYINSSIFAFSSRFEGFGMVLIEAMACGLPVVSFDCPCGPKDIVSVNEDGLLIENGDVDKFSKGLDALIRDESLRKRMSKSARKNVERFKIDHVSPMWRTLFDKI